MAIDKSRGAAAGKTMDKKAALETALAQIEKQFGKGAVMRLGQNEAMHVEAIPTGSLSLDLALGIGGLPRGRIVEIYGPESSGKTTLALHCIAEGQKNGGNAAFIDVEHALDPVYARALKFYSSVRIDIRRVETLKNGTEQIGSRTRARVVKNKIAPPFREAEFDVMYGRGISREGELLDLAVKLDIVQKSGAWFSYKQERLGQGRDNVKTLFATNKELADEIEQQVRDNIGALYAKSAVPMPNASPAKPLEVPAASTPAAEPAKPAASRAGSAKIDIEADDVE